MAVKWSEHAPRQQQRTYKLHDAARRGDVDAIIAVLSGADGAGGADVDERDFHSRTPLHLAAWAGAEAAVEVLIGFNANVNAQAKDGVTPLPMAAGGGHLECCKMLIGTGKASCGVRTTNKLQTPLHVTALNAKKSSDRARASRGAEESTEDAVTSEDPVMELIKYLVRKKSDIFAEDRSGRTARDMATRDDVRAFLSSEMDAQEAQRVEAAEAKQQRPMKVGAKRSGVADELAESDSFKGGAEGTGGAPEGKRQRRVALSHLEMDEEVDEG